MSSRIRARRSAARESEVGPAGLPRGRGNRGERVRPDQESGSRPEKAIRQRGRQSPPSPTRRRA